MSGPEKLRMCAPGVVFLALCLASLRSTHIKASTSQQMNEPNPTAPAPSANWPPPPADVLPLKPKFPCSVVSPTPLARYQVRLSTEQEKRALALYGRSIVITAHDH